MSAVAARAREPGRQRLREISGKVGWGIVAAGSYGAGRFIARSNCSPAAACEFRNVH